jgi:hypothetical protein
MNSPGSSVAIGTMCSRPNPLMPETRVELYIVRMKKVTASEARRQWFRLLDEAAQGEVIVVQRNGRRLVLRRGRFRRSTSSVIATIFSAGTAGSMRG